MRKPTGQFAKLAELLNSRTKIMFEVGNKRPDGKYNVWHKVQLGPHYWDWIVDRVCDSLEEARKHVNTRNGFSERERLNG